MRKLVMAFGLAICLMAIMLLVVSADTPTPGEQPRGKPATPPGLEKKTPPVEKEKDDDKVKGRHAVFGAVTIKRATDFVVTTKQGETAIVSVTKNTRFHIPTQKDAGFNDLNIGDSVAINGTPTKDGLEAKKVGIVPGKPSIQHRVGVVQEYKSGESITIKDVRGETGVFQMTEETEIRNPKGEGVKVGDRITVVSRRDPSTNKFTARAIVVHSN